MVGTGHDVTGPDRVLGKGRTFAIAPGGRRIEDEHARATGVGRSQGRHVLDGVGL
jgi:hypothetical protein